MVEPQPSKLMTRVRFPSPAPSPVPSCLYSHLDVYKRQANVSSSMAEGLSLARAALDSGAARARLDAFVQLTKTLGP